MNATPAIKPEIADLVKRALAGEQLQINRFNKSTKAFWSGWEDVVTTTGHLSNLLCGYSTLQYRIKPEPIPDRVYYEAVRLTKVAGMPRDPTYLQRHYKNCPIVKLTISTDENGVETKKVEIVE